MHSSTNQNSGRANNQPSAFRRFWTKVTDSLKASEPDSLSILKPAEQLEDRFLLSAILPVYVDGVFSFGDPNSDAPYGLENTFKLASRPGATKTIYMDFDGHHSTGNSWGHDIMFPAFDRDGNPGSFSNNELIEIQRQFQAVVEDFLPFDVNVTTIDPGVDALINSGGADDAWGIRSLATQATDGFGNGIGGVAFIGSFDWNEDAPAFTFNKGPSVGGMTHSHEVGHALTLRHDGLGGQQYHPGSGTGETSWGPIMGAPFNSNLVHWSDGQYPNSTNTEDDLVKITTENGFGFRPDDHGDATFSATALTIVNETEASGWGIIGNRADKDFFSFSTGSGVVNFDINPFIDDPNLDIEAKLYNENGSLLATSNPLNQLGASFNLNLDAGTYYISIDGVGVNGLYTDYGSLGFFSIVGDVVKPSELSDQVVGESGLININHKWTTVNFTKDYIDPVVIASVNSNEGIAQLTLRIRNITSNSFDIQIDEWDYLDGRHLTEKVSYMVIESGVHRLDNGQMILAGNISARHDLYHVEFADEFEETPVVFSQTVTRNGGSAVTTRHSGIDTDGFNIWLQEEEGNDGKHTYETISWVAFDTTVSSFGELGFHSGLAENINHELSSVDILQSFDNVPLFFVGLQTNFDSDTATVRVTDVTTDMASFFVQEERSGDTENFHQFENVGFLAIDSGELTAETQIGEAGRITNLTNQWRTVFLSQTYKNPVVVAGMVSLNEADPVTTRIRNVTSNSFDIQIDEWDYLNRTHGSEVVNYFVVEAGIHQLTDGTMIVANKDFANHNWRQLDYGYEFDEKPVLLNQVTSEEGGSAVNTRLRRVTKTGFEHLMQEQESADGTHKLEEMSWIAVERGFGNSNGKLFESFLFDGIDHEGSELFFQSSFENVPIVLGSIHTYRDNDTVVLRVGEDGITDRSGSFFLQEETSFDPEVEHAVEQIGVFAIDSGLLPGITKDIFGSNVDGGVFTPQAFTIQQRMAVVPRITYVDTGIEFESIWMPLADSESYVSLLSANGDLLGNNNNDLAFASSIDTGFEGLATDNDSVAFALMSQSQVDDSTDSDESQTRLEIDSYTSEISTNSSRASSTELSSDQKIKFVMDELFPG